jgi:glycosyltransferase involved in cell wall biosynthesis
VFLFPAAGIAYADPWTQPFAVRLGRLGRGSRRVAYFYERPDTSTFRYRVWNMIEALRAAAPDVGAAWFSAEDLEYADAILGACDVLVICRTRYSVDLARLIAAARARGRRVLFDVDDLVFDDRYVQLALETLDTPCGETDMDHYFAHFGRIGAAMRLCEGVIATNEYLAARAAAFCGLPTAVVPNFLNAAQLEASRRVLDAKRASGFARDGQVHLGYFSGTPTHNRDFQIIAGALARLLRRDRRLVLRLVGFLDPGGALAAFADRIERRPLQDFLNLQRLIGEVELNLVPLQDNAFTNCKSELKVFEAAAVGTLSVASPSFTLRRAVADGETGWLAPAQAWEEVLERAIASLDAAYPPMAEAAHAAALARHGPAAQAPAILAALFGR